MGLKLSRGAGVSGYETVDIVRLEERFFSPFGRILEPSAGERPEVSEPGNFDFYVPFKELSQGWQIGYLTCTCKKLHRLERHSNTAEVFCPLEGTPLLVVSEDPAVHGSGSTKWAVKGFLLDKPIVFNRGVWHGVLSVTGKSTILIVESPDVTDEFLTLEMPLTVP
jgi:ureidoglycolate hydrolase